MAEAVEQLSLIRLACASGSQSQAKFFFFYDSNDFACDAQPSDDTNVTA